MRHTHLFGRPPKGATLAEYGLLVGLLALVAIGAIWGFGHNIRALFSTAQLETPTDTAAAPPATLRTMSAPVAGCSSPDKIYHSLSGTQVILDKNLWAPLNNGTPENPEFVCITSAEGAPSTASPWEWTWNIPGANGVIAAYPGIVFGQKPWNGHTSAPASAPITSRDVTLSYEYTADTITGRYNMAASSWLLEGPESTPDSIVGEVMVWVENEGVYPAGTKIATDIAIGGVVYDLWHEPNMIDQTGTIDPWSYFAFVAQGTHRTGTIPMHSFMQYLVDHNLISPTLNMASIEMGTEIIEGGGTIHLNTAAVTGLTGLAANWDWAPISPFSFPTTTVPFDHAPARVVSPYIDIVGLEGIPRTFTVSSNAPANDAQAVSNVVGTPAAADGHMQYGTALDVSTPAPGETTTVTLDIEGVRGEWMVVREAAPPPPPFALTMNNGINYAQIMYADLGIPHDTYTFSLSGTGNSAPVIQPEFSHAGTGTSGQTVPWGIAVLIQTPPTGVSETITLVINGQTVQWVVTGP